MSDSDYDKERAEEKSGHGLDDTEHVEKDTAYTPGSEQEQEYKQKDPVPDTIDDDVDQNVEVAPGTGGPDDQGDVDVDPDDINLPTRGSD
ncbi:hypothetical protein [Paramicrobacterium agarici]|uniref:hypothetical protein n=1 Tax=Paramicrobacterium agarici TaxID=630514 RepID=UPI00114D9E06|nr:hypothetical protein [Microbacterium agarici]TQO22792.1 hypothetical protein FB385_1632 [Microbacterium agarici]